MAHINRYLVHRYGLHSKKNFVQVTLQTNGSWPNIRFPAEEPNRGLIYAMMNNKDPDNVNVTHQQQQDEEDQKKVCIVK